MSKTKQFFGRWLFQLSWLLPIGLFSYIAVSTENKPMIFWTFIFLIIIGFIVQLFTKSDEL